MGGLFFYWQVVTWHSCVCRAIQSLSRFVITNPSTFECPT